MGAPPAVSLTKNYRCSPFLQKFYSGSAYAVSSDGSFMACAYNAEIKLIETSNSSVRETLEGDEEEVTALILSPDDRFLVSASHSRLIRVWNLSSFKCIRDDAIFGLVRLEKMVVQIQICSEFNGAVLLEM
ncbi:hypothetical protein KSP40_PGU007755 [Platanthera guangdongensis]|uniref:Uncharacterized protein n=1 Tax=Platanthera guangdongensis TaxID=2320717 RepID=A0ABR2LV89_9ASPA